MTSRGTRNEVPSTGSGPTQDVPAAATEIFGARLGLACDYARLLAVAGVERGLIGPREAPRLWTRHLLNSAAISIWIPASSDVIDLGSGAGLPGIPLALARPDLRIVLVEPMARRAAFLEEVVHALGLDVEVQHARGEDLPRSSTDVVVARAVAPMKRLIPLAMPLLRPGGRLVALKGSTAAAELAEAAAELAQWPRARAAVLRAATGDGEATAVMIGIDGALPDSGGSSR